MVKSLILVEGSEDIQFIKILLKYLEVDKKNIVVQKLDNKSNFFQIEVYSKKILFQ